MFDTIVVPLDGSSAAERVLAYVARLPSRRVRLLQVFPDVSDLVPDPDLLDAWRRARAEDAEAYLGHLAEPLRGQGREVDQAWAFGEPAEQIVTAAAPGDLIAMSTHGRGLAGRVLLGSVADRVVRHAAAPTLLVRAGERPTGGAEVARLVVPLDGSKLAEQALPVAAELARELGVPVRLVRALDVDLVRAAVQAGPAVAAAHAASQARLETGILAELEARAASLREQGAAATAEVLHGAAVPALLAALAPDDLLVLTTHGRGNVGRWLLGSVAEPLVRQAVAPVLLVRARRNGAR